MADFPNYTPTQQTLPPVAQTTAGLMSPQVTPAAVVGDNVTMPTAGITTGNQTSGLSLPPAASQLPGRTLPTFLDPSDPAAASAATMGATATPAS